MVKIRLARFGKKKQPTYRVVVSDVRKDTEGTYIESIGNYNPSVQPKEIKIDTERAQYWLSQGAQATDVVHNLLVDQKIIDEPKRSASKHYVPKAEAEEAEVGAPESAEGEAADAPAEDAPAAEEPKEEAPVEAPEEKEAEAEPEAEAEESKE